jgi:hypothetical protein
MKTQNFTTLADRLSLDRLKHARSPRRTSSGTEMKRDVKPERAAAEGEGEQQKTASVKDLIANLLVPEKDTTGVDFERLIVKRGAKRFAEWIEKELEK